MFPPPVATITLPFIRHTLEVEEFMRPFDACTLTRSANGTGRLLLRHRVRGYSDGRIPKVNNLLCWGTGEI